MDEIKPVAWMVDSELRGHFITEYESEAFGLTGILESEPKSVVPLYPESAITTLQARITELEAKLAGVERDAGRYRRLFIMDVAACDLSFLFKFATKEQADSWIDMAQPTDKKDGGYDAAIAAEKEQGT